MRVPVYGTATCNRMYNVRQYMYITLHCKICILMCMYMYMYTHTCKYTPELNTAF